MTDALTTFAPDALYIRGRNIRDMIESMTFIGGILWMLDESKSEPHIERMLNALLVAWIDHGEEPPSTQNVRNVATVAQSFPMACIAGLATFGGIHVPIDQAARFLVTMEHLAGASVAQLEFIQSTLKRGKIPGLGHPVHAMDPRVGPLLAAAAECADGLSHCQALHDAERILSSLVHGEGPRANLAGVTAAIWLDLGFSVDTVGLIPVLGRTVGWAAHYAQQRSFPPFST